jgi:hypothetical protein
MATQSEVRVLEGAIRKRGFKIVRTGNGAHKKILDKKGAVVVDKDGPLILSGSPGDRRWIEMHVHRLTHAGVLNPFKPTPSGQEPKEGEANGKPKGKRADLQDPAIRARMLQTIQDKSAASKEATARLRARWEPILAKLGGWSERGGDPHHRGGVSIVEFTEVMQHWATVRGRTEMPKKTQRGTPMNMGAMTQITRNLKIPGNTIGDYWMPLFKVFVDELEMKAGSPVDSQKAANRYLELLKEMKGITAAPQAPPAGPPTLAPQPLPQTPHEALPEPTPLRPQTPPVLGPATRVHAPRLALETLYLLARRDSSGTDEKRIIGLAAEIAELELNREGGS